MTQPEPLFILAAMLALLAVGLQAPEQATRVVLVLMVGAGLVTCAAVVGL